MLALAQDCASKRAMRVKPFRIAAPSPDGRVARQCVAVFGLSAAQPLQLLAVQARRFLFRVFLFAGFVLPVIQTTAAIPAAFIGDWRGAVMPVAQAHHGASGRQRGQAEHDAATAQGLNGHYLRPTKKLLQAFL